MNRRQFLKTTLISAVSFTLSKSFRTNAQEIRTGVVRCPILMYHYVSPLPPDADMYRTDLTVDPSLFEQHCAYLSTNGYTTITLQQLYTALFADGELPAKPIILTFDDGYADAPAFAVPILQAYRQVGTFFIVSNLMGTNGYMTWEQAAGMLSAGMEIENHSATHADLRRTSGNVLASETDGSAATIEQVLGKRSRFFCYPGGRYNNTTIRALRDSGHLMAVTTQDGTLHYASNPFRLKRVRIRSNTSTSSLEWLINRSI